jgi:hypothetical protein
MTECKSTMMDLKKKINDDSDETNPQLIGSLMYPINTRLDSCRFRLSRKYSGPEEHILLMFYLEIFHGFLLQQETYEISLIPLIKIFATDLLFCLADLIHWGFLDAFQLYV